MVNRQAVPKNATARIKPKLSPINSGLTMAAQFRCGTWGAYEQDKSCCGFGRSLSDREGFVQAGTLGGSAEPRIPDRTRRQAIARWRPHQRGSAHASTGHHL